MSDRAMTDDLKTELLRIVQAIAFPSPGLVVLAGRSAPQAAAGPMAGVMPAADPLVAQLQQLLYDWCYCRRFDPAAPHPKSDASIDATFLESLVAANAGRERWDAGWRIQQTLPSGQVVAVKGAMTRMVWPGEFLTHGPPGMPPNPGTEISLFAPKESRTMQPGFYFVFGEALADQEEETSLVRFYWHVTAAGAAPLVAGVTQALNRFAIPFRFKCLAMPQLYDRTDPAILYLAKRHHRVAAELLSDVYDAVRPFLEPTVPLFSKPLAGGWSLAENPKTGESFGMNRCRVVAEAVCDAHARGIDAPEARLSQIAAAFEAVGLSLASPFLNPGSRDLYEFREGR
jgi:type III HopA1-like effector protein